MGTPTTNYGWLKPTIGADSTTWGTELNGSLDGIDSTVHTVSGVASAALPAASYTAADVLAKIKTVDGSGSGLDADTVDSHDSTYFTNASNITSGNLPVSQLPVTALRLSNTTLSASVTFSATAPSGGQNGDIWLQYS